MEPLVRRAVPDGRLAPPESDEGYVQIRVRFLKLVQNDRFRLLRIEAARTGAENGEGDGPPTFLHAERQGVSHRVANRAFARPPEVVDPGHVDDPFEGKIARRGRYGLSQAEPAVTGDFFEWLGTGSPLDGAAYALGQEQPPGDGVAIPGVDDGVHGLVEKIAVYHLYGHDALLIS